MQIVALKNLDCENIVQLKSVLRSSQNIWIVMECLGGGSLLDCLMSYGRFDEEQSRMYIHQIVTGIEFCHAHSIFHRDLKPDNILLSTDLLTVKVADFGLATLVEKDSEEWRNSRCGSIQYAAPELFSPQNQSYLPGPIDIWGIGLLLYIMVAGFPPFQDGVNANLIQKITSAVVKFPPWFSPSLKDLIRKILKIDPAQRLTIQQIKEHEWYTEAALAARPLQSSSRRLNSTFRNASKRKLTSTNQNVLSNESSRPESSDSDLHRSGITVISDPEVDLDESDLIPTVNAFSLINMTGAFDLTRIFDGPRKKPFTLMHSTKFVWNQTSISSAFQKILDIVSSKTISVKKNDRAARLIITAYRNVGTLRFYIQLYILLPDTCLVEFVHLDGPEEAFYQYYKSLYKEIQPLTKTGTVAQQPGTQAPTWLKSIPDLEFDSGALLEEYTM